MEASLVYRVSFRTAQVTQRNPVLKNQPIQTPHHHHHHYNNNNNNTHKSRETHKSTACTLT